MLKPTLLRQLNTDSPAQAGRNAHLSAGSGLVVAGQSFYVVADDELALAEFPLKGKKPGTWHQLLPGVLPLEHRPRKRAKPDFEALALVTGPEGRRALLAVPSGSTANRTRGALLMLNARGKVQADSKPVDFKPLFDTLWQGFPQLNIEGAAAQGNRLVLVHRGTANNPECALIELDWCCVVEDLWQRRRVTDEGLAPSHKRLTLGTLQEIPLTLTDIAPLGRDCLVFTAAAEDTDDAYEDGDCAGSAAGIIDRNGNIAYLDYLGCNSKLEGVWPRCSGSDLRLLLVSDNDDAAEPAALLEVSLPASVRDFACR